MLKIKLHIVLFYISLFVLFLLKKTSSQRSGNPYVSKDTYDSKHSHDSRESQDSYGSYDLYDTYNLKNPYNDIKKIRSTPSDLSYDSKYQYDSHRSSPSDLSRDSKYQYDPYRTYHSRQPYYVHPTEIKLLHLNEGDFCRRTHSVEPDHVCMNQIECNVPATDSTMYGNHLPICSFNGSRIIVCCPLSKKMVIVIPDTEEPATTTRPTVAPQTKKPTKATRPTTKGTTVMPYTKVPTKATQPITKCTTNAPYTKIPPKVTQSKIKVTTIAPLTKVSTKVTRPNVETTKVTPIMKAPPEAVQTTSNSPTTSLPAGIPNRNANTVAEMCRRYSRLLPEKHYANTKILNSPDASPQEFPHMALLGYGNTTESRDDWRCGGSLINERWVLTAANCLQRKGALVRWVRLGEYDIESTNDLAQAKDYKILRYVAHPDYKPSERYNDIALILLDSEVEFSAFVRPICLNSDPLSNPLMQIATGWGSISTDGGKSDTLLKVTLEVISENQCNATYFSEENNLKLKFGITPDSMICAGAVNENEDACFGFSGGPLQISNNEINRLTYTQFGITSFGYSFCGIKENPGVYTRVSKYISWIENIIKPNN